MCGLFGWQYPTDNQPTPEQRTIIGVNLAQRMINRGRDACGYATEGEDGIVYFDKDTGEFDRSHLLLASVGNTNLIGHTRFATVGSKIKANAHPFVVGNIVGAHNGGIFNHKEIAEKYKRKDYDVDSIHLIAHIAEGKDCKELEGYGTVTWYDMSDPGAIYLCRMLRGDLEVEILPNKLGIVWASTRYAITEALRPACLWSQSKMFNPKFDVVYRVFNGEIEATERKIELTSLAQAAKARQDDTCNMYGGGATGYGMGFFGRGGGTPSAKSITTTPPARVIVPKSIKGATAAEDSAYRRAVAQYNRDLQASGLAPSAEDAELITHGKVVTLIRGVKRNGGLSNKKRKQLGRLLQQTEHHNAECACGPCREAFKLAVQEGQ